MMPFGKGNTKPFGAKGKATPFGAKGRSTPFAEAPTPTIPPTPKKGKNPFAFAGGGSVANASPTHKAGPASNPPSSFSALDDGQPSGGGQIRGTRLATRGKKFQGVF
jgi:hypothetical protein